MVSSFMCQRCGCGEMKCVGVWGLIMVDNENGQSSMACFMTVFLASST